MIDVKIMAVIARQVYAEYVLEQVKENPTAKICYDSQGYKGGGNPWYNAKRIWMMEPAEGCTHKLVLQDDIDLVYEFLYYVNKCLKFRPDAVWSFYTGNEAEKFIPDDTTTPFVRMRGCRMCAPAILMPNKYISRIVKDTDTIFGTDYKHDDDRICWWCMMNGVDVFTVIPALIHHRKIQSTLNGHNRIRQSKFWVGKDISKLNIDWGTNTFAESKFVLPNMWQPDEKYREKVKEYRSIAKAKEKRKYYGYY